MSAIALAIAAHVDASDLMIYYFSVLPLRKNNYYLYKYNNFKQQNLFGQVLHRSFS